jgi:hypothetical protein
MISAINPPAWLSLSRIDNSLWSPAHNSPWAIDCISRGEWAEGAFLTDQQLSELNSIPKIDPLQQSKSFRLM